MDYVAVARAPSPMSRRTRHAPRPLAADPLPQPPLPPPPLQTRATSISNGVQVQQQESQTWMDLQHETRTTSISNGVQAQQQPSQRRMDLEHEVAELKQQLSNEQMVHDVLERALHPASAASARSVVLNIPAFIPAKTKELLAELVLVEEEIARLESQITTMKGGLAAAQHQRASAVATMAHSSDPLSVYTNGGNANGGGGGTTHNGTTVHSLTPKSASTRPVAIPNTAGGMTGNGMTVHSSVPTSGSTRPVAMPTTTNSNPPSVYPTKASGNVGDSAMGNDTGSAHLVPVSSTRQPVDQVPPEIKSMFFISQAMNAEYLKRHIATDDKPAKSTKDHQARVSGAAAVGPKLNTIFALPPRNSLDNNKHSDRSGEKPFKAIKEPSPAPPPAAKRDDQNKIQPNRMSEKIVKCLVVIFIRLLRSSRAAEMEKSGNLARSGNLQGSFRIDAALNLAAAKEKERGQQDHYGIFAVQDSVVRDIGPYKNIVRFTSSAFDLRGFSSSPLLTKLREMLEALQQVDLRFLTHQQKLAFWLNIYNTCIMHGILQHGLPSNSEKLLALKNKATINVSGQKFNPLVIENFILRQPSSVKEEFWKCDVDVEEQQVRNLYGLNSSEPNIIFALCCGIRSSPVLRIYKAERVMMDLEKAKLDYLQASVVVTSTRKLMIPSLIHSNMHDFAKDMESMLRWICDQLPTSWSLRKFMVDCLRGQQAHSKVDGVVEVIPYDYEFQYLLPL